MKTIWSEPRQRELKARLARLTPGARARWGRMTAPQMVVHLSDAFRMAAGELPVAASRHPVRYPPLKQLVVYLLPLPKGAPTAPELLSRTPVEWSADMQELERRFDEFVRRGPSGTAGAHPLFGRMSGRAWGVLAYKHTDHHLRQFGL